MTDFEKQYCLKHGIEYTPPSRAGAERDYSLRPLEPSAGFAHPALVTTVDDIATIQGTTNGIMAIHRGPDGWVPFYRKKDGDFQAVASIPVKELPTLLPGMINALSENAYMAINTMYRPGWGESAIVPGLRAAGRRKAWVRWVNACLVDLDVGREGENGAKGLTWWQALGALFGAVDAGIIPKMSIVARSGRGLYAMWCLKADDGKAQPGLKWAIETSERINKELVSRLEALAADPKAVDAARIIRIPGTKHSVTGDPSEYWIIPGGDGSGITYTLKQLADQLGLAPPCIGSQAKPKRIKDTPLCIDTTQDKETITSAQERAKMTGAMGQRTLWRNRYNEALMVEDALGGIPQGRRRACIVLLGVFAYRAGMDASQVAQSMHAMAKRCNPPYPSFDDCPTEELIGSVLNGTHGRWQKLNKNYLGRQFMVTADMAKRLNISSLVPAHIEQQIKQAVAQDKLDDINAREKTALGIVREWIQTKAKYPSGRVLSIELTNKGYPVKQAMAYNILNELRRKYPELPPKANSGQGGRKRQ